MNRGEIWWADLAEPRGSEHEHQAVADRVGQVAMFGEVVEEVRADRQQHAQG
jgi:hypothetical protein